MRLLPLLCVALLAAGCYDSRFGERGDDATPEPVTATIRQLREKFAGTTFPVTGDIVVSGRVTTSDYDENFYRTFCIEEDGAGIEVMAGIDHLHNDFPEGCQVTLRLRGLALGESHGVLQAGRMPAAGSGFATDYIGSKAALDAAVTRNGEALEPIAPTLLSPGELTPERCGTLVRIGALSYTPEDLTPGTWAGYKRFTDDTGAAVYTYVRSYARFADDEVPVGRCTLTGILQYDATGEGRYILKLRDENDWAVNRLPAISRTALRTAVSVVLALTALAGCDKASGLEFDDDTPQGTVTIAALKSRCTGAQAAVTEDITIEGVVTGNDLYGEFYKTLVVEDTSGGISIAVDATELYVDYPVGTAVTIHCNGLFLCDYGGKVMLGTRPTDEYAGPGRIPPGGGGAVPAAEAGGNQAPTASDVHVRGGRHAAYRHLRAFRRGTVRAAGQLVRPPIPRPDAPRRPNGGSRITRDGNSSSARQVRAPMPRSPYRRAQAPYMG